MDVIHNYYRKTYKYQVNLKNYLDWLDTEDELKIELLSDDFESLEREKSNLNLKEKENEYEWKINEN